MTRLGGLCSGPLPAPRARQAGEKDRGFTPPHRDRAGFILIGSYLMLSLLLIYASGITTSTNTQQLAMSRLNDRYEALNLAQGAMDQFREDLFEFLRAEVYQKTFKSDAIQTFQWLDQLGAGSGALLAQRPFDLTILGDRGATGDGSSKVAIPRTIALPAGLKACQGAACQGQAWMVSVAPTVPPNMFERDVTIEAVATVGAVTKRRRTTSRFGLQVSDIFRYAYFINNYGWFKLPTNSSSPKSITINGEIRSNGNLDFQGYTDGSGILPKLAINGDLYASENPDVGATGEVTGGTPNQSSSLTNYWDNKAYYFSARTRARPAKQLTLTGQPVIGTGMSGPPEKLKVEGEGWEQHTPDKRIFKHQPIQDMPYLGDLSVYETYATAYIGKGLDGVAGTADDTTGSFLKYRQGLVIQTIDPTHPYTGTGPLILDGTVTPIQIDGPVVIHNDVIIKGTVKGRGTIYASRNVHIVGPVTYQDPPSWPAATRTAATGQIKTSDGTPLGYVCNDGSTPATACP